MLNRAALAFQKLFQSGRGKWNPNELVKRNVSTMKEEGKQTVAKKDHWLYFYGLTGGLGAGLLLSTAGVEASDHVHAPEMPWSFKGWFSAGDTAARRRGFEVYRQVCATCHNMQYVHFRELIGHTHTEEQAKALSQSYEIQDGPNDEGEMYERPGKLADPLPDAFVNEEMARFANGGALPPDLSILSKSRHSGADYVYSLLLGYTDAPHGMELRQGLYYNPYFPGGAIGMAPPLVEDGQVEYEDGTPSTISQNAKDVAEYLAWASEPETDARKRAGVKMAGALLLLIPVAGVAKRHMWSVAKNRRVYWPRSGQK